MTYPVPPGQIPRDEKFWNTFYAVIAEREETYRQRRCLVLGHHDELRFRADGVPQCEQCGLSGDELMVSAGFVKQGDVWVNEHGPLPSPFRFNPVDGPK